MDATVTTFLSCYLTKVILELFSVATSEEPPARFSTSSIDFNRASSLRFIQIISVAAIPILLAAAIMAG